MNERLDLYLRAHTVVLDQPKRGSPKDAISATSKLPKWPDYAVVFGCESRTEITQDLTFGFYRVLKLNGDTRRELVKASTYREYERRIDEYQRRRQRPKHSL